jgi:hypothetical protein
LAVHTNAAAPLLLVFDEGREHEMFVVGKKETISPYLTPSLPTGLKRSVAACSFKGEKTYDKA